MSNGAQIGFEQDLAAVSADLLSGTSVLLAAAYGMGRSYFIEELYKRLALGGEVDVLLASPHSPTTILQALAHDETPPTNGSASGRRQVWLVDDAQVLPEETVAGLTRHILAGRITVLLAVESRLDGSFREDVDLRYDHYRSLFTSYASIRRYDLRRLSDDEARMLIDCVPGGSSLPYGVRELIVANAGGFRFAVRDLVREAASVTGAAQFEVVQRASPRIIAALARATAHMTEAADIALSMLGTIPGLALEHALASISAAAVESLLEEHWVAAIGAERTLVANPIAVAVSRSRVDRQRLDAVLDGWATRAIREGRFVTDRAVARGLAELWLQGGTTRERIVTLDDEARLSIVVGAAWWCNDAGQPSRALVYADLDISLAADPRLRVEQFRALRSTGRIDTGIRLIEGVDPGRFDSELLGHLLRVCIIGYHTSPSFAPLVRRLVAEASERRIEVGEEAALFEMLHLTVDYAWEEVVNRFDSTKVAAMRRFPRLHALEIAMIAALYTGRFDFAKDLLVEASHVSLEQASGRPITPVFELSLLVGGSYAASVTGLRFIDVASRLKAATTEAARGQHLDALALATLVHGLQAHGRGDWSTAAIDLDLVNAVATHAWWAQWWGPQTLLARTDSHLQLGDVDAAEAIVEHALVTSATEGSSAWFGAKTGEAKVALGAGDPARAERIQRDLLAHVRVLPPLLEHRTRFRLWRLTGDEDSARRVLELSAEIDYPLGAEFAAVVTAAANHDTRRLVSSPLLSATLGLPESSAATGALSEREREIALLVAGGLSNREIAERLYLSVRTVESHIYQARSKVGASTRGELGQIAVAAR